VLWVLGTVLLVLNYLLQVDGAFVHKMMAAWLNEAQPAEAVKRSEEQGKGVSEGEAVGVAVAEPVGAVGVAEAVAVAEAPTRGDAQGRTSATGAVRTSSSATPAPPEAMTGTNVGCGGRSGSTGTSVANALFSRGAGAPETRQLGGEGWEQGGEWEEQAQGGQAEALMPLAIDMTLRVRHCKADVRVLRDVGLTYETYDEPHRGLYATITHFSKPELPWASDVRAYKGGGSSKKAGWSDGASRCGVAGGGQGSCSDGGGGRGMVMSQSEICFKLHKSRLRSIKDDDKGSY
jgi:hypothetical protein